MAQSTDTVAVSFEVYPPRSAEKMPDLQESIRVLDSVSPDFISVTFGAGGSSTRDSLEVLRFIRDESSATPLAHLTCVGTTRQEASELVVSFLAEGITHFLALRGDLPEGALEHHGELHYAVDLVTLMRELPGAPKPLERIAVAAFPNGHPESHSLDHDVETLLRKQEAGATLAITQLFFYTEHYLTFVGEGSWGWSNHSDTAWPHAGRLARSAQSRGGTQRREPPLRALRGAVLHRRCRGARGNRCGLDGTHGEGTR